MNGKCNNLDCLECYDYYGTKGMGHNLSCKGCHTTLDAHTGKCPLCTTPNMKGIVLNDLLKPTVIKDKRSEKIVLKSCLQLSAGEWNVMTNGFSTSGRSATCTFILIVRGYLNPTLGPDIIASVNDGVIGNIYGGEWNGGEF